MGFVKERLIKHYFMHKYFGLYGKAFEKVRKDHSQLFDHRRGTYFRKSSDFLSNRNNWYVIFLLVGICFAIPLVFNCEFLNVITISEKTLNILVDQRTTNIATIISISLVVVGFLINNLAVKSPTTYKLLFKKSLLYLTIYLTLSTIFWFIVLSTLRDTIPQHPFSRSVVAGTYLSLFILVLIGILFRNIIYYTNEKEINSMLSKELIKEAKNNLKTILLKKYSSKIYQEFMSERGLKRRTNDMNLDILFSAQNVTNDDLFSAESNTKNRYLKNVNLAILKVLVKTDFIKEYDVLTLGDLVNVKSLNTISFKAEKYEGLKKWLLKRCFYTSKKPVLKEVSDDYRKEFDSKILQLAEESKHKSLSQPLSAFIELYKLQMQHQNENI